MPHHASTLGIKPIRVGSSPYFSANARNHAVLLAGELGASARLNTRARLAWIADVRGECERAGIGWALWGYDDVMGFDISRPPPPRPVLDAALLEALGLNAATDNGPTNKDPGRSPGGVTGRLHVWETLGVDDPRSAQGTEQPSLSR
jgi:hypothetical protein